MRQKQKETWRVRSAHDLMLTTSSGMYGGQWKWFHVFSDDVTADKKQQDEF